MNSILNPPRPVSDPAMLSKRLRIMMYYEDLFIGLRANVDQFSRSWTAVSRKPLTKQEMQSGNAIAFYDIGESKTQQMGYNLCELSVFVEFYHAMKIGDHASDELNMMLTDIQRAFRIDINCGNLAINVLEKRSQVDVDGPLEKCVAGVVEFTITYRHAADDPRK
jgi:hypothetical protein